MSMRSYPTTRMRRLRRAPFIRDLVQEHHLSPSDFIWPLFVIEGDDIIEPIASMPGVNRYSIDQLVEQAKQAVKWQIPAIAVHRKIDADLKDSSGQLAYDEENLVCRAVRAVKQACPELGVICDVALDPFTDHGHDGIMRGDRIANDETIQHLSQVSLAQKPERGLDIIAPSDMMDGRIGAIRAGLDAHGFEDVAILSGQICLCFMALSEML